MTRVEIRFKRKSYEDGFGFSCMKAAYLFGITGRLDYSPENGVRILAEGDQGMMSEFVKWIETNVNDSHNLFFNNSLNYSGKYKEFDIYRHTV